MYRLAKLATCGVLCFFTLFSLVQAKPDPGKINIVLSPEFPHSTEQRPLLANTKIYVQFQCTSEAETPDLMISWKIAKHPCLYDDHMLRLVNDNPGLAQNSSITQIIQTGESLEKCNGGLSVLRDKQETTAAAAQQPAGPVAAAVAAASSGGQKVRREEDHPFLKNQHPLKPNKKPIVTIPDDGIYELELSMQTSPQGQPFRASVQVEFLGPHGYISAVDYPFLPFYLIMCIAYVIFGIIWLAVSFMQWRDLLRIQFWIGGVILLGMLEKAFFYAEYQSLNSTGLPVREAELVAEFVSCAKRTLARMLVIIMSLGFGIVKPRLGPMLHRVVGVGTLYFLLACIESYLRVNNEKSQRNELLVASIPLAVLDTGICWWIFTSLVQTTRTLRLRRNMVKLALYRHFTNTLIFAVIASVIFMLFALRLRSSENCTPGWRDIWIDTGFWHILFSVLLLVIMILWRPTNNNQRYAFTPLLDNPEDEDDEEEEDQFVADAYGIKMRGSHANGSAKSPTNTTTEEDDLRWVEENIPSSMADPALPVLDSDEEIINTKFEVSKMQ